MEIDARRLEPGMILMEDIIGKSNRPMFEKNKHLTEKDIFFIQKFMIPSVSVSSPSMSKEKREQTTAASDNSKMKIETAVKIYRKMYHNWQNNMPLQNLYDIRQSFTSLFESINDNSFLKIAFSHQKCTEETDVAEKSVWMSLLAVFLAKELHYEKKDWLQIGFAALLADSGFVKLNPELAMEKDQERPTEQFRLHPIYSYKFVETLATLTKKSKVAILQHQEHLDGSGYPAKMTAEKINAYARIIAVCDYFYRINLNEVSEIIHLLDMKKGVKLEEQVIDLLIYHMTNR